MPLQNKMRYRILPLLTGFLLGGILCFGAFHLSTWIEQFPLSRDLLLFILAGIVILAAAVIAMIDMARRSRYNKKTESAFRTLYEEKDVAEFINQMTGLLEKTKNKLSRQIALMNLALGYYCAGDTSTAIQSMDQIETRFFNSSKYFAIYYNNLLEFYLAERDYIMVKRMYDEGEKYFTKYWKAQEPDGSLLSTMANKLLSEGKLTAAEELFNRAKVTHNISSFELESIELHLAEIYYRTDRFEDAQAVISYLLSQKTLPRIHQEAEKINLQLARKDEAYEQAEW